MTDDRPLALVYRGPAACAECPQALADLLISADPRFEIRFVGDAERHTISRATLAGATLYAQPGGGRSLQRAYRRVKASTPLIRQYVRCGGRYLGICMGGYLADGWRGFGILPRGVEADPYVGSPGADVTSRADTVVNVRWRGSKTPRPLFFQDGPLFRIPAEPPAGVSVLGRYAATGDIAALLAPYGRGWVAVCGPHPEAPDEWYAEHALPGSHRDGASVGHDLVNALLGAGLDRWPAPTSTEVARRPEG